MIMFCPTCSAPCPTTVVDSRPTELDGIATVRRRRVCDACGGRQTTYEINADALELALDRSNLLADMIAAKGDGEASIGLAMRIMQGI